MTARPSAQRRFAWAVVALLFLGSVLNYVDRTVLGVVKVEIRRDLDLSDFDYGMVVSAFLVAYMVFYVWGGPGPTGGAAAACLS
jgi:ACS family hexuronate transporter-like MFS transporter